MKPPISSRFSYRCAIAGLAILLPAMSWAQTPVSLTVSADQPPTAINPLFSGMMIEEINHSMDGGLYGELIQNRVFKDDAQKPVCWSAVGGATIALDSGNPLDDALPVSLRVDASTPATGVANSGFWGIPVRPAMQYRASFYAKAAPGFTGTVTVAIESADGSTVYARGQSRPLTSNWQPYTVSLTTGNVPATAKARFVLVLDRPGTVWLNLVSLFPPTWNGRPNGLRPDLMKMLVDLRPAFLRLPGGNALEGDSFEKRFDWKKTVGPLSARPGHQGPWLYRSSDGMGLLEYLQWAEDMGAEPLLAVYAGYSLSGKHINPGPDLEPYVQDALDEIEYVTGSTSTKWGAQRAKDGHPAPFTLHYVEIGNEDWFDRSPSYSARFTQFRDAIKDRYPNLLCISTIGNEHPARQRVKGTPPDLVDEHYYKSAKDFEKISPNYYEKYSRTGPDIFVGEWAAYEDIIPWDKRSAPLPRTPSMKSALADACWMADMERNADIVKLQCYAPLLVNVNPGASQWRPNLIGYDALNVYGSPSYYAIKLFNLHRGDQVIKATITNPPGGPAAPIQYSVTRDSHAGVLYIKLININAAAQPVAITLQGIQSVAQPALAETLSASSQADTNSMAQPTAIAPVESPIPDASKSFTYKVAPYSITVLQLHAS
jgi:alpha-N-arabinofuranosidase